MRMRIYSLVSLYFASETFLKREQKIKVRRKVIAS